MKSSAARSSGLDGGSFRVPGAMTPDGARRMTGLPVPVDLKVEHQVDPIGLDEPRPRLSWRVELAHPAIQQASFAIEVARDQTFASAAVVWARTAVASADTAIVHDGPRPGSRERRFWRVRVVDDRG